MPQDCEIEMRVLVCGGRDFENAVYLQSVLDAFHCGEIITSLIHGDCGRSEVKTGKTIGADWLGADWAITIPVTAYPADWSKHGRAAGPIRNQQMLDEGKPDLVIAFAGGRGTDDMCRRAQAAGIEVHRYWPGDLK